MTVTRSGQIAGGKTSEQPARKRWSLQPGRVMRRALGNDPAHEYFIYVPANMAPGSPLFVGVHGISRNANGMARRFTALCDQFGVAMITPFFTKGHSRDYQRLGRTGKGPRADKALNSMLDEAALLTGADTARICLFGFSGGAQFVHRYAMAYPHRVAAAVVVAAGWYTFPDARRRFPYGIRRSRDLADVRFDPEEFLRVPITAMVGEHDTSASDLRSTPRAARQGKDRVERARNWVEAMRAAATACNVDPAASLEVVQGGNHSFAGLMEKGRLGERVFTLLFGTRRPQATGDGNG